MLPREEGCDLVKRDVIKWRGTSCDEERDPVGRDLVGGPTLVMGDVLSLEEGRGLLMRDVHSCDEGRDLVMRHVIWRGRDLLRRSRDPGARWRLQAVGPRAWSVPKVAHLTVTRTVTLAVTRAVTRPRKVTWIVTLG